MKPLPEPSTIIFGEPLYTAEQMREYAQDPEEAFCDSHCVWTNHHPDCVRASSQESVKKWTWDEVREYTKERIAAHMREIDASRQEQRLAQGSLRWIDADGVRHTMPVDAAKEFLAKFFDEWPGGFDEIESAIRTASRQEPASPAATITPKGVPPVGVPEVVPVLQPDPITEYYSETKRSKCNEKQIGWELERTAMGDSYYGNALYVAQDMPCIDGKDRAVLHRYLHGSELTSDRFRLQEIAMKIYRSAAAPSPEVKTNPQEN